MYLGSRTVKLIERDAAQPINEWRTEYLSWASEQMGGQAGKLPKDHNHREAFLSRASLADINRFVPYADRVYPTSEEVHIAPQRFRGIPTESAALPLHPMALFSHLAA